MKYIIKIPFESYQRKNPNALFKGLKVIPENLVLIDASPQTISFVDDFGIARNKYKTEIGFPSQLYVYEEADNLEDLINYLEMYKGIILVVDMINL